jgi:invasion protein IalB
MRKQKFLILGLWAAFGLLLFCAGGSPANAAETEKKNATSAAEAEGVDPNADQWFVRCEDKEQDGKKTKHCEAFQRLAIKKTNQRLVEFAVAYLGTEKKPHGTIIVPLGTLIERGVEVRVDGEPPAQYTMRYCTPDGCFVHFPLSETSLNAMRKGNKIVVTFVLAMPKKLNVELSLKGFSKALDQL